jgi:hypothetical protein
VDGLLLTVPTWVWAPGSSVGLVAVSWPHPLRGFELPAPPTLGVGPLYPLVGFAILYFPVDCGEDSGRTASATAGRVLRVTGPGAQPLGGGRAFPAVATLCVGCPVLGSCGCSSALAINRLYDYSAVDIGPSTTGASHRTFPRRATGRRTECTRRGSAPRGALPSISPPSVALTPGRGCR